MTAQPENLGIALSGRSKASLAMVALVEGEGTANSGISELVCDCGEVNVGHAFSLVLSVWEAYSSVRVVEYRVGRRAMIDDDYGNASDSSKLIPNFSWNESGLCQ